MAVKATAQETVFDLTDAYSIMLTSESYTFNGNTSGVPAGKTCSTQVVAYLGGTPMKSNISKVTCPTGISVSLKDNNTIAPTVTFTTTATVTEDCEASISVTVDDVTISKKFSFAVAKTGSKGDTGAAGNGIKSISYYYARSSSQTAPSESSITGTSLPTLDATNKYLWQKEIITYTNNTSQTTVVLLAVYGNTGAKGDKGNDGTSVTIKSQAVTYQASSSGTTIPSGTWSPGIPTVAKGQYLWTRTVITFSNDVTSISYSVGYMGTNGQNGSNGSNGKDGKGIKSTEVTYQIWENGTSTPNGTWVTTVPDTTADKPYLWTRTVITYTDNSKSISYSVGSTLKGVNIGGRNLLLHSSMIGEKLKCDDTIFMNSVTSLEYETDGLHLITPSSGNQNNGVGFIYNDFTKLGINAGDTIVFSLLVKGSSDDNDPFINIIFQNDGETWYGENILMSLESYFTPTDAFQKVYIAYTLPKNENYTSKTMFLGVHGNQKSDLYIKNLKLELGNIATDWTPAPEDVDEGINNAQSSADKANTNASNAQQSANNAQDTANKADAKADQAKADSAAANAAAQIAKKQADEAQRKSNTANDIANGAVATISPIAQVVIVDDKGLKILNSENNTSYAQMQSTGLFVFVNKEQRAVFGATSKVENMAIQDYLMFGSHRAETKIEDGEEGTAFFHIGDVK